MSIFPLFKIIYASLITGIKQREDVKKLYLPLFNRKITPPIYL